MGSKGNRRHTKRLNTSKYTHINKKRYTFYLNTRPGTHSKDQSIPLISLLRDILKVAKNRKEAQIILNDGKVFVDGVVRKDGRFPVGLMDVVDIPLLKKAYRMLPHPKKGLYPLEIPDKEKSFKLCRIENKSTVKGGHIQLNLHDGRNITIEVKDPTKPKEDKYKTMGVLKITLPEQEIKNYYPLNEESPILVVQGKNLGMTGSITEISKQFGPNANIVKIATREDVIHETAYAYSFVLGNKRSVISLFEESKT